VFEKGLVPPIWAQHFSGLRGMLESGVPTARNRLGGHGQGTDIVDVPKHFVAFAIHQTAAAIVFLALLAGCQFSESRYLIRTVKSDEVLGAWRATAFAIKSLRDVGVQEHLTAGEHTLVLRPDGSCSVRTIMNMPVMRLEAVDYRTYDTGCRWRLGDVGHQALQLDLTPAPPVGPPHFYFDEEDGHLLLWQYATDPDARRYMEFERSGA